MIGVALRGLAGRKFRTVLTAIAIVLGVAMMSGAYVLTDTIDKAFNAIFVESYAGTDAVVSGKGADISFEGETSESPPIPEDVLERVRAVDGVQVATGSVTDPQTKLLNADGESIDTGGAPSFAFGIETAPEYERFNPLNLVEGRWPSGSEEVAIDEGVADDESLALGDRIGVAALGPAREYEIAGIARYGDVSSLGGATFAIFDVPTAQALLDKEGELDAVQAAAQDGVAPEELVARIREELGTSVTVRSGTEQASEDSDEVATFTSIIQYFLLSFAGIALFVGAFVIFNTLSITVVQRTREFATLRTVGASRRQVLGSVILEALVIGLLASIIGLFAGLGLAVGLNELFTALNLDLPQTETVFATRTIVVSLLVGTVVTLIAGLSPAFRATRVAPIAAVREGAKLPRSALSRFGPYIAAATIVLAVLALSYAMLAPDVATGDRFILLGVGVLALFIGVALLSSRLVVPLTRLVGWPARRIGGASGQLAEGNAIRDPGRTASTAAALMIGIALVTFVGVLAQGLRVSNSDAIEEQIQADLVVTSQDGYTEFPAAVGDAAAKIDGTDVVSNVRQDVAEVDGSGANLTGLDGSSINQVYNFRWTDGSDEVLASLGDDGAVVPDDVADDKDLAIGDSFTVLSPDNERRRVRRPRDLRREPLLSAARHREHLAGRLRRALRQAAQPLHADQRSRWPRRGGEDERRARPRGVRRHARPDPTGMDRQGGRGDQPVPAPAVRTARLVGDRQPLRNDQHARAVGIRADARARNAAGRRHDEASDAPHGPARERDHGSDRRRARVAARDLPRAARDAGAVGVRPPVRHTHRRADHVRDRVRHRRHRRRDPACSSRRPPARPRSTPIRVAGHESIARASARAGAEAKCSSATRATRLPIVQCDQAPAS